MGARLFAPRDWQGRARAYRRAGVGVGGQSGTSPAMAMAMAMATGSGQGSGQGGRSMRTVPAGATPVLLLGVQPIAASCKHDSV
jgi:hypothetical protein